MITLGIDLSSQRQATAACLIDWTTDTPAIEAPALSCSDADLDALIAKADVVGIDAPFGWPAAFVEAVAGWQFTEWNTQLRDRLRFRVTDCIVRERQKRWPLSVSTDTIALPAMRAMALLARHGVSNRSGNGRFFEVYPAASLHAWGISNRGYKEAKKEACLEARRAILNELRGKLSLLYSPEEYARDADALDSLIASLTARSAAQGGCYPPPPDQLATISREGWIYVPTGFPQAEKAREQSR